MIWKEVNARYIKEGEILIDSALIGDWWTELQIMNGHKEGRPYEYPTTFFRWVSLLRTVFRRPYRQLQGFLQGLSKYLPIPFVPNFRTIHRRLKELGLNIIKELVDPHDNMIIGIDSTGIKVSNRSEWLRHKWKIKKGWLKLHVAVDVKTHKVVSANLTTEETGDAVVAEHMLMEITKKSSFKKLLADGAYDKNALFDILKKNGIEAAIRTRKDAVSDKGSKLRREEVRLSYNIGEERWKKEKEYGKRWNVEIWISAYKRRFGEVARAVSWKGMINEIITNVMVLNWIYKKRDEL